MAATSSGAAAPLMNTPAQATAIIVTPPSDAGAASRWTASTRIPPTAIRRIMALSSAASIDELRRLGVARAWALRAEHARDASGDEAEHVARIVTGVGEKGDRTAHQAKECRDDDEAEIERNRERENAARPIPMRVTMAMVVKAVVMPRMVVVVRRVRHEPILHAPIFEASGVRGRGHRRPRRESPATA